MKKFNVMMIVALMATMFTACTKEKVDDTNKVDYSIVIHKQDGTEVIVKDGDSFVFDKIMEGETSKIEMNGVLKSNKEFILMVDVKRPIGLETQLCIGICKIGNMEGSEQFRFPIEFEEGKSEIGIQAHSMPKETGDHIIEYTFYPKDDSSNKISFKVNYKKP